MVSVKMATSMFRIFADDERRIIESSRLLVVGAGGIGCELLKNLVLTGFKHIELIDLDTIDVSNLNRQFLFRKQHIGKSKALVAKESAQRFNHDAVIRAYHDNIMSPDYGVDFFGRFSAVMNALDNKAARSHVNRMCLAANVPLVESGTAGYLGQVTVIKKGVTECYECQPKPAQKTYPGCTIRNTPSEPVHCVVWAKHLFNQLFGEADPDEDVSPDMADPELGAQGSAEIALRHASDTGNIQRISTRTWAIACEYDSVKLFNKLFRDDICYLLSMDKLWQKRRPPEPLDWGKLPDAVASTSNQCQPGIKDQEVWSVRECAAVFQKSLLSLKKTSQKLQKGDHLVWDKDNNDCMDFVTSCANIRSYCFGIPQKSRFDIKSIAGNIIPAIATTNAIISGLVVMQLLKVLKNRITQCNTVYLNKLPNPKKKLLVPCVLDRPNPKCYVCSTQSEVSVNMNTKSLKVQTLEEKLLKGQLHMVAPDVEIDDGKGTILISSEKGETEENNEKFLADFGIRNGTRLKCDDFLQNFNMVLNIFQCEKLKDGEEFEIISDLSTLQPPLKEDQVQINNIDRSENENDFSFEDEDDVLVVDEGSFHMKRKTDDDDDDTPSRKKARSDIIVV